MGKIPKEIFERVRQRLEYSLMVHLGYRNINGAWAEVKRLRLKPVGVRKYLASGVYLYGINEEDYSEKFREVFSGVTVEI